jgi:hypothetical protein
MGQYEDAVKNIADRLGAPSSPAIRVTNRKTFVMPDGTELAGPLPFVIVDFVAENRYYKIPFNPNNITPPDCAATAVKPDELVAFDESPDKQHADCKTCSLNAFGSAGRGKACTNARLLALLDPLAPPGSPLLRLRSSPTAITPFESYVRTLATKFGKLPAFVLTYIGFDPTSDYATLRFGNPKPLDLDEEFTVAGKVLYGPELIQEAIQRLQEAREMLLAKPDFTVAEPSKQSTPQARAASSRRATT